MDLDVKYPANTALRLRAKRRIPHFVFEYLVSATGIEDQHDRNQSQLRNIHFMPEVLHG